MIDAGQIQDTTERTRSAFADVTLRYRKAIAFYQRTLAQLN